MERMQEIIGVAVNYLQGTAREEFGNLASLALAIAAGTMLFFLAPVGLAVNALRAVIGYALLGSSLTSNMSTTRRALLIFNTRVLNRN